MRIDLVSVPPQADDLTRQISARRASFDCRRAMPAAATSPTHGQKVRTFKQWPPFADAMARDIRVREAVSSCDRDHPR